MERNWDIISEDIRKESIQGIIDFFKTESGDEIGVIAAEAILDQFLQTTGQAAYNKGVEDCIAILRERVEGLEVDMESLLKR